MNTYPCIKELIHEEQNLVVLFSDKRCGTVIHSTCDAAWEKGDYIEGWNEQEFKLFGGTIELRND